MSFTFQSDEVFVKVCPLVLHVEGGFVDDPKDPGGPTKFGIAFNFNAGALQKLGLTRETMNQLTKEQAMQLYFDRYWLASGASGISDEGLAFFHLDTAVNCGVGAARKMLKGLSKDPRFFDGRGKNNEILFLRLLMEYAVLRLDYYTRLRKDLKERYLEGWINRMEFVINKARELV